MWATANLIEEVGCENVHIDCEATDVAYVLENYKEKGVDLKQVHDCLW
jgi:hypothetical protein